MVWCVGGAWPTVQRRVAVGRRAGTSTHARSRRRTRRPTRCCFRRARRRALRRSRDWDELMVTDGRGRRDEGNVLDACGMYAGRPQDVSTDAEPEPGRSLRTLAISFSLLQQGLPLGTARIALSQPLVTLHPPSVAPTALALTDTSSFCFYFLLGTTLPRPRPRPRPRPTH